MRVDQYSEISKPAWFEISARTQRRIERMAATVGIGILMFTLGGAMEGRGLANQTIGVVSDTATSEPQSTHASRPRTFKLQ